MGEIFNIKNLISKKGVGPFTFEKLRLPKTYLTLRKIKTQKCVLFFQGVLR